ncbi:hypothetical protein PVIIG_05755 [Plasmodium vivax India VII]|uniref:Variable surface protein n=1 Tax=Plasmodium vivax India VII TaxID=1077284 RepID=A0A0J9SI69_PLAVI|nr:hypothetical protein PVIIG_05755 [Plasmodium vivax India VII]
MDLSLSQEINEWKFKYPFLKKIWNLFEDFSNEVTDDDNPLHVVCDVIAAYYPEKINEYQEFCKILLKNLENVSVSENKQESETEAENLEDHMDNNTRCTNLNRWLYYYTKIHHVPDEFIKQVFSAMYDVLTPWGDKIKYTKCIYESYRDDYAEPEDIIKLLTFVDNHDVIQSILMNEHSNVYDSCVNYINECDTIYRKLNTKHCGVNKSSDKKYIILCQDLETFKNSYTSLYYIPVIREKRTHFGSPQLEDKAAELQIHDVQVSKNEDTDFQSNPMKSKITTAVTAGIGACSFLGILYKVNRNYYIYRNITYLIFFILNDSDESVAFAYM